MSGVGDQIITSDETFESVGLDGLIDGDVIGELLLGL